MSLDAVASRVRGMLGRFVLGLVNDATKMQSVQGTIYAEQTPDDLEHFQNYGFTSVPLAGAEGLSLALSGSAGSIVVINVDDRRFRLKGLESGEVALYDDIGHIFLLGREGVSLDAGGHAVRLFNLPKLRVEGDIEATGQIKDKCDDASGRSMQQMRTSHSGHTHKSNGTGVQSDAPLQAL